MYVYEQMEMEATNKDDNSFTSHIGNLMDIDSILTFEHVKDDINSSIQVFIG